MVKEILSSLVTAVGGPAVILTGLFIFLGRIWIGRALENERRKTAAFLEELKSSYKLQVDTQLEHFKAVLNRDQALLNTALMISSNQHTAAQERRLEAIKLMWQATLDCRTAAGTALLYYDFIFPAYKTNPFDNPTLKKSLLDEGYGSSLSAAPKLLSIAPDIEQQRPFLGENLWRWFFGYRMLTGRVVVLLGQSVAENTVIPWEDGNDIKGLLSSVFSSEELEKAKSMRMQKLHWFLRLFEEKIMEQTNRVISGQLAGEDSLEQGRRIAEAAAHLQAQMSQNSTITGKDLSPKITK